MFMNKIRTNLIVFLITAFSFVASSQEIAKGYVFNDLNKNEKKDRSETGIANVAVSNGLDVVLTDKVGLYKIPVYDDNTIFVIKPSGYKTPTDENYINRFFYHHKVKGSPSNFKYKGFEPMGSLPKSIYFSLEKYNEPDNFSVVVFGDPQPYSIKELDYFSEKIVKDVSLKENSLFGISLGDIAGNNLDLHPLYKERMRLLKLPWYNVMGNHDMNMEAEEDKLSDDTFEKNFGSANYAFNYGKAHLIILDDILYPDPRDGKGYWDIEQTR